MKFNAIRFTLIMILATCMLTGVIWAVPPEKPERIRINSVGWSSEGSEFIVFLAAQFGAATAGEKAGFLLNTTLEFEANEKEFILDGEGSVVKLSGAVRDSDGFIQLEPLAVMWDRDGGTFSGSVDVMVTVELINPSGVVIASVGLRIENVDVNGPPEPPPGDEPI